MTIEAILASLHLLAILTFVVFLSSQAALCRSEWMSAAVVQRLARLDMIYGLAVVFLVLTGIARLVWGVKGMSWYVSQPLFHLKMTLFVLILLVGVGNNLLTSFYAKMNKATLNFEELGVMLVFCVALLMLVNRVPPLVAGIITGSTPGT